ncbi:hypothetical protein DFA_03914 [Cavenderia fasciculata]|uniref:ABC transporter domain-containing protein n=1 Tax=Cavenderia fasciculata TaxID=261658 RepID=F4Q0R9_CACFS|nr:uncharacterized protein DFA_03914 [Cavenderia fasciculata]EGG18420.1 hypothetical protein DFA_03914 [Cavenderia fasciculata]|eukprot:XP_004366324.1 hypothetical protein DFA_03914 [Cavenderia fasciculata]
MEPNNNNNNNNIDEDIELEIKKKANIDRMLGDIELEEKKKNEENYHMDVTFDDDDGDQDIDLKVRNHEFSFVNQFSALFKKSIAYQKRQYKTNILQALVPVLMISIMSLVQLATPPILYPDNQHPISFPPPFIFPPTLNLTVPYLVSPTINLAELGSCCQNNSGLLGLFTTSYQTSKDPQYPALGLIPTESFQFQRYPSQKVLDYSSYHQGATIGNFDFLMSYIFNKLNVKPGLSAETDIALLSNNTVSSSSIISPIHNAIYKKLTGDINSTLITGVRPFPNFATEEKKDMIQPQENFWYLFMLSFCMVIFVSNVVYEKENRLRESMKMAGLRMRVYWLVTYMFNFSLYLVIVFVAIAFAYILKFKFFTETSFSVYFVLFILFGMTQISFSFFISVFFSSVYTSTVVSFIYIIFTALSSNLLNNAFIENPDTNLATFVITALVPHVAFHRAVSYISLAYVDNMPGLTWDRIFEHHQMPSLYGLLFGEFLLFTLLHQYMEMVIPSSYGVRHHPLFFLQKSFWHFKIYGTSPTTVNQINNNQNNQNMNNNSDNNLTSVLDMLPPDIVDENRYTYSNECSASVRIMNLSKTFKVMNRTIQAVDNLTLSVEKGQCFGLLGPNGSGKTTTLCVLSGLYSPTKGSAIIDGHNIIDSLGKAQQSLGVCAQDDVLWGEMSGREHLLFYGRMKNLNGQALIKIVNRSLEEVMLTDAQHKAVREYSGGMKRRLMLAISLIGTPSVVLLDEPTAGVDIYSRRIVWNVINSYKSKCAIILTTHNMEEAEVLCDRVCIIDNGQMKCIGRNGDLKIRYGAGHTLSVSTEHDTDINEFLYRTIPDVKLIHQISLTKSYAVPRSSGLKLSALFNTILNNKDNYGITDWGICQSGLEEVLLQATSTDTNNHINVNNNSHNIIHHDTNNNSNEIAMNTIVDHQHA